MTQSDTEDDSLKPSKPNKKRAKTIKKDVPNVHTSRHKSVRVKTARGRKISSKLWLERQLNDPYVIEAKRLGYRSRAAFKLLEIDEKYDLIHSGQNLLDLGCAPGGWTQILVERSQSLEQSLNPNEKKGHVVGIDLQEFEGIPGAHLIQKDFMDNDAPDLLKDMMGGPADGVLSDMAPFTTGHKQTDHLRIMGLVEAAAYFAFEILKPNGFFVCKVFAGGTQHDLLTVLKKNFTKVSHFKPQSSRKGSPETFVIAQGFRGQNEFSNLQQND